VVGNISISRIEISFEPELIDPTGTDLVFNPLRRLQKSFVKPQTKLGETLNGETLRLAVKVFLPFQWQRPFSTSTGNNDNMRCLKNRLKIWAYSQKLEERKTEEERE
jgi:hypothetical protein